MKNPSFDSDKDRWELDRSGGDSLRNPFRNVALSVLMLFCKICGLGYTVN